MGWANRKVQRAAAIDRLHDMLEALPVIGFPYWLCLFVLMPLSVLWVAFEAARAVLALAVALLVLVMVVVITPFQVLLVWFDVSMIAVWCFLRAAKKLSGRL